MFNLEPLKGYELTTCTPFNVGPSTYTIADTTYVRKNVVPFLSSAKRSRPLKSNVDVFYDVPTLRSKIKYGNSLQFTTVRETINLGENFEASDYTRPKLPRVKKTKWKKNTGRLYQCRMPFSLGPKIPSIPSHADANGYDISDLNELIKNPADDHDLTIGPAFYVVPRGELNFNTKRYGGCAWANSKDKRLKTASFQGPGPGYYDVNYNFCGHRREDEQIRATMRKCCGAPRYTCELICRAKRENIPGPGAYETVDLRELGKIKCLSLHPRPFIDSQERFVEKVTAGPGPQEYSACDCVLLKRNFGIKNVPFSCNSERLKGASAKPSPGPGWYPTPSGMAEKLLAKRYGAVSVPFGSNLVRKWTFQEVPLDTPSYVDYDINEPRCCPTECPHETSVFRSRVCRFRRKKPDNRPEPASYNITKAVHFCRNRVSHAKRRRGFNATERKFLPDNDFASPIYEDTPGVGDYEISGTLVLDKAMKFDNKPRFKPIKCFPGPGYYTLHPEYGDSLNRTKTTHNARLMKEVKRNYCDARIPKATVKAPQPTGKKLLRWFVRPPEQPPC